MSSQALPPNPSLIAILLVVRSSSEPRLIFHYPPKPGEDNAKFNHLFKDDLAETSSTSSDRESSEGKEAPRLQDAQSSGFASSPPDVEETGSASPSKNLAGVRHGHRRPQWNDVLGHQAGSLARALSSIPANLRRFEMSLGDFTYLGRPVFANEDGSWRKVRRHSSSISKSLGGKGNLAPGSAKSFAKSAAIQGSASDDMTSSEQDIETQDDPEGQEQETTKDSGGMSGGNLKSTSKPTSSKPFLKDPLTMFHVVYVLNPPPLEYHARVKDAWVHIVKKFSRALKWEQARLEYVSREVSIMTSAVKRMRKANGDNLQLPTLYQEIISQSGLAKALALLYMGISNSRIAHLNLRPSFSLSLQIPVPRYISTLPSPLKRPTPGLWLTTATTVPADDDLHLSSMQLDSHFTLLLLCDLNTILADLNAKSPVTGPLTHYLTVTTPTKSFSQVSQTSGIPLADIQVMASHLIYWRRAQAIPPLHQRDTYIVSPNADMQNLISATSNFAKTFPTLPSLPKLLSMLSSAPRPYSSLIPSKDHKKIYMDILAWLLRGGWVTQLRSFAWVLVPVHIKRAVDRQSQASEGREEYEGLQDEPRSGEEAATLAIPGLLGTSPVSSTGTAVPLGGQPSRDSSRVLSNPRMASAVPSRYLSAISRHVDRQLGSESRAAWDRCIKYFDGQHAVESIAVREGWKRKHVAELVAEWQGLGLLVTARHW